MVRILSLRNIIGIVVVVVTLITTTCYFLLQNNKEQISFSPNYKDPSSIVESYSSAKLHGETELVIECIVPEKPLLVPLLVSHLEKYSVI
jgi:hypothetical protein